MVLPSALAGCTGNTGRLASGNGAVEAPTASFEMTATTPADLAEVVLPVFDGDERSDRRVRLFERVLDGGATAEGTDPPLHTGHYIHEGTVYDLSREVVERTPATRYSVKMDIVQETPGPSAVVRFSDLPAVDRETFAERGLAEGEVVGIGTTLVYTDAERERSALVPESEYDVVAWSDGTRAEWVVDDAYDTTLKTYRYTADQIGTQVEYGRRVRDRFAFELSRLSDAERSVVETAVAKEQYVIEADATPSPAFATLVGRFEEREQLRDLDDGVESDGEVSGTYAVRYDGDLYRVDLAVQDDSFGTRASG